MKNLLLSVLAFACVFSFCIEARSQTLPQKQSSNSEKPTEFSFCDVIAQPKNFEGKLIKMSVLYQEALIGDILLTAPACEDSYMDFTFSDDDEAKYKETKEKIARSVKFDLENKSYGEARLTITGVLEKDKIEGHRPIKNLLQNYTFHIKEVE